MNLQEKKLKIAICGTRGIPARYGGFETFAEELSTRLAARGHFVCVYGRKHFSVPGMDDYRGVQLRNLWAPRHKYFETPVHGLLTFLHLVMNPVDVAFVCNAANSPFLWVLRLFRQVVVVNVDGIERMRGKWNLLGRLWYRLGELTSVWFSNLVIADADVIADYYHETYSIHPRVIAYGCDKTYESKVISKIHGHATSLSPEIDAEKLFGELGIRTDGYILYVSRLEPENNAHLVIAAYKALPESCRRIPLVIVGDAPYAESYIKRLRSEAQGENIIFTGFRFGQDYKALQLGAYLYIQATEVGGTHPALVEAMGFGNCVIANGTPENKEVLGDAGAFYAKNSVDELTRQLEHFIASPAANSEKRRLAFARAYARYDWDMITTDYENLAKMLVK